MSEIIGMRKTSFVPQGSDKPIEGMNFFLADAIDPQHGTGVSAEKIYLSDAKVKALDFTPAIGDRVEVMYNKFAKIVTVRLLDSAIDLD